MLFRAAAEAGDKTNDRRCCRGFSCCLRLLVALNSSGWVAPDITTGLQAASRWCLVLAIAALGTKTSLGELAKVGWRPVGLIVAETVFVGPPGPWRTFAAPRGLTAARLRGNPLNSGVCGFVQRRQRVFFCTKTKTRR
jgi:hypothetical protein